MSVLRELAGGREHPLRGKVTLIGRDPGCDVVVRTDQTSSRHAIIVQSGGAYSTPTLISSSSLTGAAFVGLGANHSCAGTLSATLFCWGANGVYQVDSTGQDQKSPRQSTVSARAVAGGTGHTCAIGDDQSLQCWGLDDKGQLGVASSDYGPFDVGLHGVTAVAAGNKHTCAVANGTTLCWGLNDRGQLGVDLTATPSTYTPRAVSSP